ncbi:hypothetical protein Tco_1564427 [Tanacetum coccineum]
MALIPAAGVILGIGPMKSASFLVLGSSPCGRYLLRKAFVRRSEVVMDPADNRFIHNLAFPFNVKGNAMSITWSLDTPGDWKRLTTDVIFEMYSSGFSSLFPRNTLSFSSSMH